jgi:hypothetical protein
MAKHLDRLQLTRNSIRYRYNQQQAGADRGPTMRILITCLVLALSASAGAIVNPELERDTLRSRGSIVVRFRVVDVQHGQKGDYLWTVADAELIEVMSGDFVADPDTHVSINYQVNYMADILRFREMEENRIVGSSLTPGSPRLRPGQIAMGWFNPGAAPNSLVPAAGFYSFDTEYTPDLIYQDADKPFAMDSGQIATIRDLGLEIRIARFDNVGCCQDGVRCIHGGFWFPVISIILEGRYVEVFLMRNIRTEIPNSALEIEMIETDGTSQATLIVHRRRQ